MSDVFEELLPVKWREIEFPITRTRMSIAHDLVEHKYWGVDGAKVESTGLAPIRFLFSVPMLNGIEPGRNETWAALYPNQFRALIAAFQKKAVGILQHPEFDQFTCKAERMDIDWDATRRGGVDIELSFVETKLDFDDSSFLMGNSPIEVVDIGSIDLDEEEKRASIKELFSRAGVPLPPYLDDSKKKISLSEFAQKVKAVTDYPTLLSKRSAGQLDALLYHVNRVAESAAAAKTALTWPIIQNVERTKAAAYEIQQAWLATSRTVSLFTVPADTTLAGVARQLPEAKVSDLIRLNPGLMRQPEIPKGTVVRYYAARAAA